MSKLIITIDGNKADEVPIEYGDISIGRHKDNDIRLNDSTVSGHHARIINFFEPSSIEDIYLEDLNSTNGTYINENRVVKGTLRDGDVITIGKYQLVFEYGNDNTNARDNSQTRVLKDDEIEKLMITATSEKIKEFVDKNLIPEEVEWVAQDDEGMWWGFSSKPFESEHGWKTEANEDMYQLLQASNNEDWKQTLRKLSD